MDSPEKEHLQRPWTNCANSLHNSRLDPRVLRCCAWSLATRSPTTTQWTSAAQAPAMLPAGVLLLDSWMTGSLCEDITHLAAGT